MAWACADTQVWAAAAGPSARMATSSRDGMIDVPDVSASDLVTGSRSATRLRLPVSGSQLPMTQSRIDSIASRNPIS